MKHQLVFQFEGEDYDALVGIEDALVVGLGLSAEVDGHDMGSGESNIFIITENPVATFKKARDILRVGGLLPATFKVASRPLNAEIYTILWPPGLSQFRIA